MATTFPFLTSYDPPGTSEGTLDPLGFYQIADQLAVLLVPGVRERMQRIRFLTAMAVGAMVTEGLDSDPRQRDAAPYLVWEWLIVEAIIRSKRDDSNIWGVPGTLVAQRAIDDHKYIDAHSYLKTPRIFGFNGIYKRLALHLGVVDVHLRAASPHTKPLVDAWAKASGYGGLDGVRPLLKRWSNAIRSSLAEKPVPRTKTGWGGKEWTELADAFNPSMCRVQEKKYLRDLLLATEGRRLGALPKIWSLLDEFKVLRGEEFREEILHDRLQEREPSYAPLLEAIRAYERFARSLQDAFDILRCKAAALDAQGFDVPSIGKDADFKGCAEGVHRLYAAAQRALGEVKIENASLQNLFAGRFQRFSERTDPASCALELCDHHKRVQRDKGDKRPWFIPLGNNRIYVRQGRPYREPRRAIQPDRYLHDYRGQPIRKFYNDLT